ncbi:asparaginase, partial [Streptomyces sp. NPDC059409]
PPRGGARARGGGPRAAGRASASVVVGGACGAHGPVLARALTLLGVAGPVVDRIGRAPLLGGGREVGEIRAAF